MSAGDATNLGKKRVTISKLKFIKLEKLSISQMEKIEGGIFWGRDFTSCTAITNGAGGVLYYSRCYDYYMFWIRVETGVCQEVGDCGNYNYQ